MEKEKRYAVLIDADNVAAKYTKYILDEVSNYGIVTYKRVYGDWISSSFLPEHFNFQNYHFRLQYKCAKGKGLRQ